MGTNYYKVLPMSVDELDELDDVLATIKSDILGYGEINWNTQERLEEISHRCIHLGKSSGGWQFLWEHHDGKYYDVTLESIKEFLAREGEIFDEYGNEFSAKEFIEEIECKLYKSEKYCNAELFHKERPNEPYYSCTPKDVEIRGKVYKSDKFLEFENDGLRFSATGDFS